MAHDVFICYSSKDKTTADAVCAVLESEGIRCWIAPRDILVGMSYGEAIVDAIHHAKALVLVFSGHANASPQIEREVERAINKRIPVIPLRIEDVAPDKALEYFLSTPHWLDAFTPPLDRHLRNLAGQIRRLINMPDVPVADAAAAAGLGSGASPFKTVHTDADAAPVAAPAPEPPRPATPTPAPAAATAGAAAAAAGFVPKAASTQPATSPLAFFNKLDTPQKVGIGAAALVVLIGVGWLLSSGGSSSTPSSVVVGPSGEVTVNDGKQRIHVGPDGTTQVGPDTGNPTPSPSAPAPAPSSGTRLPSDGDVIPGHEGQAGPAPAAPSMGPETVPGGMYNTLTTADVIGVLREAGYEVQPGSAESGDPMVTGTMGGYKFTIFFYRCNKQQTPQTCLDLQFHAAFNNDTNIGNDQLNLYNRNNRFGQAYFMRNGDIGLDMSATIQGGVSRAHLKEVIDWWKVTLTGFPKKLTGG